MKRVLIFNEHDEGNRFSWIFAYEKGVINRNLENVDTHCKAVIAKKVFDGWGNYKLFVFVNGSLARSFPVNRLNAENLCDIFSYTSSPSSTGDS